MHEFLTALVSYLHSIGVANASYDAGDPYMIVADTYHYARVTGNIGSIKFEEKTWRRPYKIAQVAKLLLERLPDAIQYAKENKKRSEMYSKAAEINKFVSGGGIGIHSDGESLFMKFSHPDETTLMAAIDSLHDHGFTTDAPRANTDEFNERQVLRMWWALPTERRAEVVRQMIVRLANVGLWKTYVCDYCNEENLIGCPCPCGGNKQI